MNEEDNSLWRGFDSRLDRLEDTVKELDEILRGDRHRKIIGLISEQDRMDAELRRLNAVVFVDSTGKRGLAHDIDVLMDRRSGTERRSQYRWQFWTAIAAAIISSATAILTNWAEIKKIIPKDHPSPLEQKIEKARHPKSPKKIYIYRVVHPMPDSPAPSENTKESPPKSQE